MTKQDLAEGKEQKRSSKISGTRRYRTMSKITFGKAWEKQEAMRVERLEELRRHWQMWQDAIKMQDFYKEFIEGKRFDTYRLAEAMKKKGLL